MKRPELYTFKIDLNPRGNLGYLEELKSIPFRIRRVYWLYDIPEQEIRGGHAHKTSEQVIICTKGQIKVELESQSGEFLEYRLDKPSIGLYIPPHWWGKMIFQNEAMMIGLASDNFSEKDYIRNKDDF